MTRCNFLGVSVAQTGFTFAGFQARTAVCPQVPKFHRRAQAVRQGAEKVLCVGSIPILASIH